MEKKEYIERGALLNRNMYGNTAPITHRTYAEQLISSAPAADVVEGCMGSGKNSGEWLRQNITAGIYVLSVEKLQRSGKCTKS